MTAEYFILGSGIGISLSIFNIALLLYDAVEIVSGYQGLIAPFSTW
jgi:hypothetical protein